MNRIPASVLLITLIGCAVLTTESDLPVEVTAQIQPDAEAVDLTVRNESSETILFNQGCGLGLQYRQEGKWQGLGMPCLAILLPPIEIEAGTERVFEEPLLSPLPYVTESGERFLVGRPGRLPAGEYRFRINLTDADGNELSSKRQVSNTFRIEP